MTQSAIGPLRDPRQERFCHGVVSGLTAKEAYQQAGYKGKSATGIAKQPHIRARIKELMENAARRAELSRKDILTRMLDDWNLSRKLGQCASALRAGELMGRELHHMFTERKEVGGPGDFDNKSEEELRDIIKKELGDLGWDGEELPPPPSALN